MNYTLIAVLVAVLLSVTTFGQKPLKERPQHHAKKTKSSMNIETSAGGGGGGDELKVKWPEQRGATYTVAEQQIKAERPELDVVQVPEGEFDLLREALPGLLIPLEFNLIC